MNTSWTVLIDGCGSWMLMGVHTRRLIPLPSINTALLWHRGPEYSKSYSSQHDTKFDLLKVVICQVPTRPANYKDFRLIAFFNHGLAYPIGHCGKWINLHVHRRIIHPPWFSDAIEHKGFIYAVDFFYGWMYCWPTLVISTMAVTAVCYFPMISWWLAYITVNICWKNIHAHNMLFLRLTKSIALFYLTPTWYDVVGRPSVPTLPNPKILQRKAAWQLQVVLGLIRLRRTIDDRSHVPDVLFRGIQSQSLQGLWAGSQLLWAFRNFWLEAGK